MTSNSETISLKRFTQKGIDLALDLLQTLRESGQPDGVVMKDLAAQNTLTTRYEDVVIQKTPEFGSRWDLGKYLVNLVDENSNRLRHEDIENDRGLWTWIAFQWSDQLFLERKSRNFPIGNDARWVLGADDWRRYYKHLLAGPYQVFHAHKDDPERCRVALTGKLNSPGEIYENIAGRREIIRSANVMEFLTNLYLDPSTKRPKKGSGGKGPGASRRFGVILNQFDLTYDVYGMSPEDFKNLLPAEFDRFLD